MPTLTPVDHDPFSETVKPSSKLVPVDHDPFAPQAPGFLDRVKGDVENRFGKMGEEAARTGMGNQSSTEGAFQEAGQGAGLLGDVAGEALASAAKPVISATPEPIKKGAADIAKSIQESPVGQAGIKALKAGGDAWKSFSEAHPALADDIEAGFNIATLGLPVGKAGKAAASAPGILEKAGESLVQSGEKQSAKQSGDFVKKLVSPEQTAAVKESQVGRTTEKGLLRTKEVEPTSYEKRMSDAVSKVPGVAKGKTFQSNYNAINDEISKEAQTLERTIKANDAAISVQEMEQRASQIRTNLSKNPSLVGNAQLAAERVLDKMKELIKATGATASGLLRSRKDLDNWIRAAKGEKGFDPALENGMSVAIREIRQSTNDLINQKVPAAGVKASLEKQSLLYSALDNIEPKAAKEGNDVIQRVLKRAAHLIPGKTSLEKEGALGLAGASAAAFPHPTAAAAGIAGLAGAYKALSGPSLKKAAGHTLKLLDSMIQKAKDPKLAKELRADREVLLGIVSQGEQQTQRPEDALTSSSPAESVLQGNTDPALGAIQ